MDKKFVLFGILASVLIGGSFGMIPIGDSFADDNLSVSTEDSEAYKKQLERAEEAKKKSEERKQKLEEKQDKQKLKDEERKQKLEEKQDKQKLKDEERKQKLEEKQDKQKLKDEERKQKLEEKQDKQKLKDEERKQKLEEKQDKQKLKDEERKQKHEEKLRKLEERKEKLESDRTKLEAKLLEKANKYEEKLREIKEKYQNKIESDFSGDVEKFSAATAKLEDKLTKSEEKFAKKSEKIREKLLEKSEKLDSRTQKILDKINEGNYLGEKIGSSTISETYELVFDFDATKISDQTQTSPISGFMSFTTFDKSKSNLKLELQECRITVGDVPYNCGFGKARTSSSGNSGAKDSLVILAFLEDDLIGEVHSTLKNFLKC